MKEVKEINVLDKGKVALLEVMGSDASIAEAARISYSSNKAKPSTSDETLIRHLLRHRHTSCFEMVEFKFYLKMPIFVHNQLVRHRMANQNVMSGRYSEMPDEFYVPAEEHFTKQNPNNKQGGTNEAIKFNEMPDEAIEGFTEVGFKDLIDTEDCPWLWSKIFSTEQEMIRQNYERLLKTGVRKELARINLPLAQYTELYWKIDLHNLLHFLKLRMDSHAQYEIRVYADAMYELIKDVVPVALKAFDDYHLNAVSLTHLDQLVLEELICILEKGSLWDSSNSAPKKFSLNDVTQVISCFITNKRESDECLGKMKKFFTIED